MIKFRVEGGTHVGIKGCYGEKTFFAKDETALLEMIREERQKRYNEHQEWKKKQPFAGKALEGKRG